MGGRGQCGGGLTPADPCRPPPWSATNPLLLAFPPLTVTHAFPTDRYTLLVSPTDRYTLPQARVALDGRPKLPPPSSSDPFPRFLPPSVPVLFSQYSMNGLNSIPSPVDEGIKVPMLASALRLVAMEHSLRLGRGRRRRARPKKAVASLAAGVAAPPDGGLDAAAAAGVDDDDDGMGDDMANDDVVGNVVGDVDAEDDHDGGRRTAPQRRTATGASTR